MKKYIALLAALLPLVSLTSCRDTDSDSPTPGQTGEQDYVRKYVNTFACNMMQTYYLWTEEVSDVLNGWKTNDDPFKKVAEARYKDSAGNDIDRWTQLTDDYKALTSSVAGTSSTYGFDFTLYYYDSTRTTVCGVVTVVYPGSPADKAGLKRGDCFTKVGGKLMTAENYPDVLSDKLYDVSDCTLTLEGGPSVSMSQVTMYLDPVLLYKTFDCSGRKVGYLVYNSFTQASYLRLLEACRYFKAEGIGELVLDLRYNGGGYTVVEQALASMLAPESEVKAGSVFETEVYNKLLTEAWGTPETRFTTDFSIQDGGQKIYFSTADANIGLNKIYALVSSGTASASESLIGCLKPYMDIEVIGEKTHGKFCSGVIYSANDWYEDVKDNIGNEEYTNGIRYADNWGIYVMIGRYADKDGTTACMPDGIVPDHEVYDDPLDGYQLGDPGETMLKEALSMAGYEGAAPASACKSDFGTSLAPLPSALQPRSPGFGILISDFNRKLSK